MVVKKYKRRRKKDLKKVAERKLQKMIKEEGEEKVGSSLKKESPDWTRVSETVVKRRRENGNGSGKYQL